jgi:hypothetical protein
MVLIETPFYHFIEDHYFSSPLELIVVNVMALVLCFFYGVCVRRSHNGDETFLSGMNVAVDGFLVILGILSFFVYQGIWQVCYDFLPAGPEWLKVMVASVLLAMFILEVILGAKAVIRNIVFRLAKTAKK